MKPSLDKPLPDLVILTTMDITVREKTNIPCTLFLSDDRFLKRETLSKRFFGVINSLRAYNTHCLSLQFVHLRITAIIMWFVMEFYYSICGQYCFVLCGLVSAAKKMRPNLMAMKNKNSQGHI